MAKADTRPRRVLSLQKRRGGNYVFYIAVPKDIAHALRLEPGTKYHFHALGGILTYEPMGAE